ncbi:ketopantoate hydroxymethyltransferase [Labrenzia sp. EL_159]|nr:ketopantoate hydroxymethyltransferase [Labrenzia sp. EL_162]MBG6194787.1 ketopantoate hydroxymethyltransferase [Labrenzia sp. EL_159]
MMYFSRFMQTVVFSICLVVPVVSFADFKPGEVIVNGTYRVEGRVVTEAFTAVEQDNPDSWLRRAKCDFTASESQGDGNIAEIVFVTDKSKVTSSVKIGEKSTVVVNDVKKITLTCNTTNFPTALKPVTICGNSTGHSLKVDLLCTSL